MGEFWLIFFYLGAEKSEEMKEFGFESSWICFFLHDFGVGDQIKEAELLCLTQQS
ncbi:hypothetical protein LguiA_019965 [Lonicera macranthoides]